MGLLSKQAILQGVWDVILMAGCGALCVVGSKKAVEKALAPLSATATATAAHAAPVPTPAPEGEAESHEPEAEKSQEGHGGGASAGGGGWVYPLKTTVVNLAGDSKHHFAKVSITLEAKNETAINKLKELDHKVYDSMIEILGDTRAQDVATDAGKETLKQKLRARLNRMLPNGGVRNVYLTEFLVQ
jgi:flagellar FliL protein